MQWIIEPAPTDPNLVALATVLTLAGLCTAALTIAAVWLEVWPDRAGRGVRALLGLSIVEGMLFVAWGGPSGQGPGVLLTGTLLILLGLGLPALFGVADALGRLMNVLEERLGEFRDVCWWCGHPSPWGRLASVAPPDVRVPALVDDVRMHS